MKPENDIVTENFGDNRYMIRHGFGAHKSSLMFEVYEIDCWMEDGTLLFESREGRACTDKIEEAEKYLSGFVKWDGCSHWSFEGSTMLHLCGQEGVDELKSLFDRMLVIAQSRMPGYRFLPVPTS